MYSRFSHLSVHGVFALFLLCATVSPVQAQFGVVAGLNFESADDIDTGLADNATFDNSKGYHLGVVYQIGDGDLTLRPGLIYRQVGAYDFSSSGLRAGGRQYDIAAWQVPIDLRYNLLPDRLLGPYLLGGVLATFPRGEDEFDDAMEDVSYSFDVGAGIEITISESSISLQPELRYEFGAKSYIKEDFELGNTAFSPQEAPQFSAYTLRLNILF